MSSSLPFFISIGSWFLAYYFIKFERVYFPEHNLPVIPIKSYGYIKRKKKNIYLIIWEGNWIKILFIVEKNIK